MKALRIAVPAWDQNYQGHLQKHQVTVRGQKFRIVEVSLTTGSHNETLLARECHLYLRHIWMPSFHGKPSHWLTTLMQIRIVRGASLKAKPKLYFGGPRNSRKITWESQRLPSAKTILGRIDELVHALKKTAIKRWLA